MEKIEITPEMACKLCRMACKMTSLQGKDENMVYFAYDLWNILGGLEKINDLEINHTFIYKKETEEKIYDER